MKTASILATVLALVANVSAGPSCYSGGETQSNSQAIYHIERACKGYDGKLGAFQGFFNPGETKSACVNTAGAIRYEMNVKNQNRLNGYDLGDNDCVQRLREIVEACSHGGTQTVSGWYFRFDPNAGSC